MVIILSESNQQNSRHQLVMFPGQWGEHGNKMRCIPHNSQVLGRLVHQIVFLSNKTSEVKSVVVYPDCSDQQKKVQKQLTDLKMDGMIKLRPLHLHMHTSGKVLQATNAKMKRLMCSQVHFLKMCNNGSNLVKGNFQFWGIYFSRCPT